MKLGDHPLFLGIVFLSSAAGVAFTLWVAVTGFLNDEPIAWELLLFGVFWFWGAWSSGARLFGFKPTAYQIALEEYASELRGLPYEDAITAARSTSTQIPYALALRKIRPESKVWTAFERWGLSYLVEKDENHGRAKVTLYK